MAIDKTEVDKSEIMEVTVSFNAQKCTVQRTASDMIAINEIVNQAGKEMPFSCFLFFIAIFS